MWGLVSGQDKTCSNTKYNVSIGVNHEHSKQISKAKKSQLNLKVSLGDFTVGTNEYDITKLSLRYRNATKIKFSALNLH